MKPPISPLDPVPHDPIPFRRGGVNTLAFGKQPGWVLGNETTRLAAVIIEDEDSIKVETWDPWRNQKVDAA